MRTVKIYSYTCGGVSIHRVLYFCLSSDIGVTNYLYKNTKSSSGDICGDFVGDTFQFVFLLTCYTFLSNYVFCYDGVHELHLSQYERLQNKKYNITRAEKRREENCKSSFNIHMSIYLT